VDEVLEILKQNDIEITDEIRESLSNVVEKSSNSGNSLTQKEVKKMVRERLDQERKAYETEIEELKTEMEKLVDPEKVEEYQKKIENLEETKNDMRNGLVKDYELKMAALEAGAEDLEYFEYLVGKNEVKDKLQLDNKGNLNVTDESGNFLTENGKKVGVRKIISDFKEEKPDLFPAGGEKNTSGPTNPGGSGELAEQRRENSRKVAEQLGYVN
jgi:vacuolar-type H+-ATPase subunit I/STV1